MYYKVHIFRKVFLGVTRSKSFDKYSLWHAFTRRIMTVNPFSVFLLERGDFLSLQISMDCHIMLWKLINNTTWNI